jgi:hypothetical protein
MQEKAWTNLDRTGWPKGPWDGEPDKVQFQDADTGLPCLAVRVPELGHWCGYVGLPPGHPLHGKGCDDPLVDTLAAPGGVNFARGCDYMKGEGRGVCHVPDQGEPDSVWWLGFDCSHAWDISPGLLARIPGYPIGDAEYRTLEFVKGACSVLAAQLFVLGA